MRWALLAALIVLPAKPATIETVGPLPIGNRDMLITCHLHFASNLKGWLVCADSLFATPDGGIAWHKIDLPFQMNFSAKGIPLHGKLGPRGGWISDGSTVFATEDMGATWRKLCEIPLDSETEMVYQMDVTEDGSRVAAVVRKEGGRSEKTTLRMSDNTCRSWSQLDVAEAYSAHLFSKFGCLFGRMQIWRLGVQATLEPAPIRTLFPELQATRREFGEKPSSVTAVGDHVWAVFPSGYMLRSNNQGMSWDELARENQSWDRSRDWHMWPTIQSLSQKRLLLVGGDGYLRESNDEGLHWWAIGAKSPRLVNLSCVTTYCYAIGESANLLRIR